mmetsp:Transcript_36035/g.112646  ORF Transcript_36035/g.112646 Transcript_36035/m.112646 type:complete len:244 (-) Transcript_36035:410-1141(-)
MSLLEGTSSFSDQSHHLNRVGVKGRQLDLAGLGTAAVTPTGRGEPHAGSAQREHLAKLLEGLLVVSHLGHLQLRFGVDVLLGVDREEVAAAGEGDDDRVAEDSLTCHEDDLGGDLAVLRAQLVLKEGEDAVSVALRLMVGQEDYVLPSLELRLDLLQVVCSDDLRLVPVHQRPREVDSEGLVVEELAVGVMIVVRLVVLARHLVVAVEVVGALPFLTNQLGEGGKVVIDCELLVFIHLGGGLG